jgi:aminoglycoside 2'-N-acetyltransferase I
VHVAHTADLRAGALAAVRALLDEAFEDFTDADWDHCLGGVHAVVTVDGAVVGHAALVQRRLLIGGRALRAGYVEGVAVRADQRRRGHAGTMMAALERVVRGAYDLGALSATDEGAAVYAARGWQRWTGPTSALTPAGVRRTAEDDGSVHVLPVTAPLDLTAELTCDWRAGDLW